MYCNLLVLYIISQKVLFDNACLIMNVRTLYIHVFLPVQLISFRHAFRFNFCFWRRTMMFLPKKRFLANSPLYYVNSVK